MLHVQLLVLVVVIILSSSCHIGRHAIRTVEAFSSIHSSNVCSSRSSDPSKHGIHVRRTRVRLRETDTGGSVHGDEKQQTTITDPSSTDDDDEINYDNLFTIRQSTFVLDNQNTLETMSVRYPPEDNVRLKWMKPWRWIRRHRNPEVDTNSVKLKYDYDYYQLELLNDDDDDQKSRNLPPTTTGIVLIHPIGVGIAKWYYQRLLHGLLFNSTDQSSLPRQKSRQQRYVVLVPDLLGCGSACNPQIQLNTTTGSSKDDDDDDDQQQNQQQLEVHRLPLLNISDWSNQILHLMSTVEDTNGKGIDRWCVVANGGCSPIALKVAATVASQPPPPPQPQQQQPSQPNLPTKPVTNVILSCVPRLPFFVNATDPDKVLKSYKTLCGIPGNVFWWYSCRNRGKFIQKFSEKNLVADPVNLGSTWTANCVKTAQMQNNKNKYATFGFLAGNLQDGCNESLSTLQTINNEATNAQKGRGVQIDVIRGKDVRINRAKSWFWQKRPKTQKRQSDKKKDEKKKRYETFREYVERKGMSKGGNVRELVVGGKISLAHEDGVGYAKALLEILNDS